jgi:hypothetical protein
MLDHICDDYVSVEYLKEAGFLDAIKDLNIPSLISKIFNNLKDIFEKIKEDFGLSIKQLITAFKDKNLFAILKAIGFNIVVLVKCIKTATSLVRSGLMRVFEEIYKSSIFQELKKGTIKIDEFLNNYPILKKIGGIAIAGLLLYIWLNMTFIGDMDYDFNFNDLLNALSGNFSITDLFMSPSGIMMITLFASGFVGISFPWLGSSVYNLVLALIYTGYNNLMNKGKFKDREIVKKIRKMIPKKRV